MSAGPSMKLGVLRDDREVEIWDAPVSIPGRESSPLVARINSVSTSKCQLASPVSISHHRLVYLSRRELREIKFRPTVKRN